MTKNAKPVKTKKGAALAATAAAPRYFRSVDMLLAAVEHYRGGRPNKAAKALADAIQDPEIDQAMQQLDSQQQQLQEQDFDFNQGEQQQQMSQALARLMRSGQQQLAESQDEEDDEDDEDAEQEEQEEDDEDDGEETAGSDEEDLGMSLDDEELEDEGDSAVQAGVKARLSRAARNRSRRA